MLDLNDTQCLWLKVQCVRLMILIPSSSNTGGSGLPPTQKYQYFYDLEINNQLFYTLQFKLTLNVKLTFICLKGNSGDSIKFYFFLIFIWYTHW